MQGAIIGTTFAGYTKAGLVCFNKVMRRLGLVLSATSDFHRGHEQDLQVALK